MDKNMHQIKEQQLENGYLPFSPDSVHVEIIWLETFVLQLTVPLGKWSSLLLDLQI